jgi:hypothetical protein
MCPLLFVGAHFLTSSVRFGRPNVPKLKYRPGQRVRISRAASELLPGYVWRVVHIGVGSFNKPACYQGEYFRL